MLMGHGVLAAAAGHAEAGWTWLQPASRSSCPGLQPGQPVPAQFPLHCSKGEGPRPTFDQLGKCMPSGVFTMPQRPAARAVQGAGFQVIS